MNRFIIYFVVLFCACQNTTKTETFTPMPKEKLIPIIVDLQVLESHFQRLFGSPNLYKNSLDSSSLIIFDKYEVTRKDFIRSIGFYSGNINELFEIYEAALDSINFRMNQQIY